MRSTEALHESTASASWVCVSDVPAASDETLRSSRLDACAGRFGDQADVIRARAAAASDDAAPGLEERGVVLGHRFRRELVRRLIALRDRKAGVRICDQRDVCGLTHLTDDDDGAVRTTSAVHPDDVCAGSDQIARDLGRALTPHRA